MKPIPADLSKLRTLVDVDKWRIDSISIQFLPSQSSLAEVCPQTTVQLVKGDRDLILQSDDHDFYQFCSGLRGSLDDDGAPVFRRIADLDRYYSELKELTTDVDRKRRDAVQRCLSGRTSLTFAPEPLIAEFLESRKWGNPRYLPLKTQYFDIVAVVLLSSRRDLAVQERLQRKFPASKAYAESTDQLLGRAFGKGEKPLQSFLCFTDTANIDLDEVAAKLLAEAQRTDDLFKMLAQRGGIQGDVGFPYLIDVYRRYAEWVRPLLAVLANAACLAEGRPLPDQALGMTKAAELLRQSSYSDIVDCFDPRIRHAASHNAISYDQDRGVVRFAEVDTRGQSSGQFELSSYDEVADKARAFIDGLVPGVLTAFGLRRQTQLLLATLSGDYLKLLLLIDHEAK